MWLRVVRQLVMYLFKPFYHVPGRGEYSGDRNLVDGVGQVLETRWAVDRFKRIFFPEGLQGLLTAGTDPNRFLHIA
ncbi:hypothetical protein C477_04069 [Haloterrigena salina JCM 13891]|uniref:Uncharacterized protein n=1 Tax=Haloterrigena salina JCM 13891 TaxID=1227488 RepID=M0CJL8_9EURY|nr:hypothetical protein C477_04069 [Haloterrigena salina JCM 13891]